jgi:hypothetical protein
MRKTVNIPPYILKEAAMVLPKKKSKFNGLGRSLYGSSMEIQKL